MSMGIEGDPSDQSDRGDTVDPREPTVGLGRLVSGLVFGMAGTRMALYMSTNFLLPVIIVASVGEGAKENWLGLLQFVSGLVSILVSPLVGQWSDRTRTRWGRRIPWILVGALIGAIGLVLSGICLGGVPLLLTWTLAQFGFQCSMMILLTVIPERVEQGRRGTVSAIYGFGTVLATMLSGVVIARFTKNALLGMVVCSLILLAGSLLFCLLIPYRDNRRDEPVKREANTLDFSSRFKQSLQNFFQAFRNRDFCLVWFCIACLVLAYQIIHSREMYFIQGHFGTDSAGAASALAGTVAVQGLTTVLGIIAAGPLSDKFGRRPFLYLAGLGMALTLVATAFTPSILTFQIIYGGLFGFVFGIFNGVLPSLTADALPDKDQVGKDTGLINLSQLIPQAIGAPIGSLVLALPFGNYTILVCLGAVLALIGVILMAGVKHIR